MFLIQRPPAIGFGLSFLLLAAVGPLPGQEATLLRPGQLFDRETASLHEATLLRPGQLFDGVAASLHEDWVVLVIGDRIVAVGPESTVEVPAVTRNPEAESRKPKAGTRKPDHRT